MRVEAVETHHAIAAESRTGLYRPVEFLLALVGLIVSAPLIALSALATLVTSRGPVLFRQQRIGRYGHPFVLYKVRTMTLSQGGPQVTAGDDVRVTLVGRFLRKTKLDELPELWNVLKGEMSLVGPRPEVECYVDLESPAWQHVLTARPGITDPVTLRLRNEERLLAEIDGDREAFYLHTLQPYKLKAYSEYLNARNAWVDIKVLLQTSIAVVFPRTAPPPTQQEMTTYVRRTSGPSR